MYSQATYYLAWEKISAKKYCISLNPGVNISYKSYGTMQYFYTHTTAHRNVKCALTDGGHRWP